MRDRDPKGSRNKYEYDPHIGAIKLDRFISASVVYPTDYGFVSETLAPDGDPLDVLLSLSEPTFPGCALFANPIGLFKMSDEKGPDDHVVFVPCEDPGWNQVRDVNELPAQAAGRDQPLLLGLQGSRPDPALRSQDRDAAAATIIEAPARSRRRGH